ncbi:hypothetical protein G6F53_014242 [Rhizopus delemar]|nr:hypothetical protein G6F53_014242 [Rhizopus delemar]
MVAAAAQGTTAHLRSSDDHRQPERPSGHGDVRRGRHRRNQPDQAGAIALHLHPGHAGRRRRRRPCSRPRHGLPPPSTDRRVTPACA